MNDTTPTLLPTDETLLDRAEDALRARDLEGCRRTAEPLFREFRTQEKELTPRMERLFAVFVAAANGLDEALDLLDPSLLQHATTSRNS